MNFTEMSRLVLRELSKNSRITVTELAKLAGCSRVTATKMIDRLTRELDLRYTIEIDWSKAGSLERHVILVKFTKPVDTVFLEKFLKNERLVQDAYLCEGNFELMIYAVTSDPLEYVKWETHLASELSDYKPIIKPSEFVTSHFGFLPMNSDFVEQLGAGLHVPQKDRVLLRLLTENSRMSYTELAKKIGVTGENVRYRLFKLKNSGVIKRFTVCAQNPQGRYGILFAVNYRFNKTTSQRSALAREGYMNADSDSPLLNRFQFLAPISGSYRFLAISLFDNKKDAFERSVKRHKSIFNEEDIEIRYAHVLKALKGILPFRNLNVRDNYVVIKWD